MISVKETDMMTTEYNAIPFHFKNRLNINKKYDLTENNDFNDVEFRSYILSVIDNFYNKISDASSLDYIPLCDIYEFEKKIMKID